MFNSGGSLTVENCTVMGSNGSGLIFLSTATTLQTLRVSNSYFNHNSTAEGLDIFAKGSGAITAAIDRTDFSGNGFAGLYVDGTLGTGAINVTVTDSVAANNAFFGFLVQSSTGHSASNLTLTHVLAEGNNFAGISASTGANATLWLAQSTVTGNAAGFVVSPGDVINTYGDNYFNNNGPSTGLLTPTARL